jgi:RNA polymerase sigma-70 factor, ECF subfamily
METEQKFEHELVSRIKHDDRLALNTLFALHYQKLCLFANTYLRNTEESEEVVSDVFLNFWRSRHAIRIDRSLKSYLYTSVKNGALAMIKKRQPLFEDVEDILFNTNLLDSVDPEQVMTLKELQNQLDRAIETLPPRCKQIFIMSRMEALSYFEISEILGVSEKTVENQIVKALQLIRQVIAVINRSGNIPVS